MSDPRLKGNEVREKRWKFLIMAIVRILLLSGAPAQDLSFPHAPSVHGHEAWRRQAASSVKPAPAGEPGKPRLS